MSNIVYIATSLDGYIATKEGGLDWLHSIPNPEASDFGFNDFIASIDALVMGRNTFEMVCSFDCPWPYSKPVFVLSQSLTEIPEKFQDKAELIEGSPQEITQKLQQRGFNHLYIDGGLTVQSFLQAELIDELIITRIPIVLGGGIPLFGELVSPQSFEHVKTEVLLDALVKSHYRKTPLISP